MEWPPQFFKLEKKSGFLLHGIESTTTEILKGLLKQVFLGEGGKNNYFVSMMWVFKWSKCLWYPIHDLVAQGNIIYNWSHESLPFLIGDWVNLGTRWIRWYMQIYQLSSVSDWF